MEKLAFAVVSVLVTTEVRNEATVCLVIWLLLRQAYVSQVS